MESSELRRHSVDVPLSKALVALRRVRSLRDPSTYSINNFAVFNNLSWETSSCNGISCKLDTVHDGDDSEHCSFIGSQNCHWDDEPSDPELDYGSRKACSKDDSSEAFSGVSAQHMSLRGRRKGVDRRGHHHSSFVGRGKEGLVDGRHERDYRKKELELTWIPHSTCQLDRHMSSFERTKLESAHLERMDTALLTGKSRYSKLIKSSDAGEDIIGSSVGCPCPATVDPLMDGSGIPRSRLMNAVDLLDSCHQSCGVSCFGSKTPKFQDSDHNSDVEDHLLISAEGRGMAHLRQERGSAHIKRELALYSNSPRSFSQKFRPRSFNELVGQHVVTQSLLSAISRGKVAPLYLFYGPRGTGKTSTSRIFAAALNCLSVEHRPCGFCRQCILFYTGRVKEIKEIDVVKVNHIGRIKSLLKRAAIAPVSSRYKVFIIDECQLLRVEIWAAFLNSLEELPRYVVFVMITSDPDKLPRNAVSRCQRYHFLKIRDADTVQRLQSICIEEDLDFEEEALHFIAARSNGSLRDAETMLDQLSLLGKRVTVSVAHELIGSASDDDLLELLDLALSSDTSNTVKRARELLKSRIDPMQLISQLANLIMDILAGRCQFGNSAVRRKFFREHSSDLDVQKLRHALKVLSETEKQLRASKNQTTWLTVALLQFSTGESILLDEKNSKNCPNFAHQKGLNNAALEQLDLIWSKTAEKCQSNSLKRILLKEGKLSSIFMRKGVAIAEVEFHHPKYLSKAEKSWKLIANSLQLVLGCNVEIRFSLGPHSEQKNAKVKRSSFKLLSCSCGLEERSFSTNGDENRNLDNSSSSSNVHVKQESPGSTRSTLNKDHMLPSFDQSDTKQNHKAICFHPEDVLTIRNDEGNVLRTGSAVAHRRVKDGLPTGLKLDDASPQVKENEDCQYHDVQESNSQPMIYPKTLKLKRRMESPEASCMICLRIRPNHKLQLSIPKKTYIGTYFCPDNPYVLYSSSNTQKTSSSKLRDEHGSNKDYVVSPKLNCWKTPKFPIRKVWRRRQPRQR